MGGGHPKIWLGFGVWDCMRLAWGPDSALGVQGPLASCWRGVGGMDGGDAWV